MEAKDPRHAQRVTVTMRPDLLAWLRENSGRGKRFHSVSAAVEEAVDDLKRRTGG